ncbi:MAG TPA: c-type cytochrome, partial [Psychromonas sp.]
TYNNRSVEVDFYSVISTPQTQINNQAEKPSTYLLEVDNPLVVPINKKIRFVLTSDDVIHSWWVPDFAVKKDAVPGFINEAWTRVNDAGIYRGQCAELCGKSHGFMPVVVNAMAVDDFENWLSEAKLAQQNKAQEALALKSTTLSKDELMSLGEQVYVGNCAVCHQPTGGGLPGVFPALKGSAVATGDVNAHIDIVLNGRTGTAMQSFAKQLSLKELAAIVTYERNAWGNDTGDLVQPVQISNAMSVADGGELKTAEAAVQIAAVEEVIAEVANSATKTALATPAPDNTVLEALSRELLMSLGEQDYLTFCAACHQPTGLGITGAFPALKGSAVATGDVNAHIDIVVNGRAGTAMQPFAAQLTAKQIAAIVTYERNAWGNDTGDLVQPNDIEQAMQGEQ